MNRPTTNLKSNPVSVTGRTTGRQHVLIGRVWLAGTRTATFSSSLSLLSLVETSEKSADAIGSAFHIQKEKTELGVLSGQHA